MLRTIEKVIYTAHTHTAGGRDGWGKSSDGELDVRDPHEVGTQLEHGCGGCETAADAAAIAASPAA